MQGSIRIFSKTKRIENEKEIKIQFYEVKMKEKLRKTKPIEIYGVEWEEEANKLARSWVIINPCKHCNHPVIDGYCCDACGSSDPQYDDE